MLRGVPVGLNLYFLFFSVRTFSNNTHDPIVYEHEVLRGRLPSFARSKRIQLPLPLPKKKKKTDAHCQSPRSTRYKYNGLTKSLECFLQVEMIEET